MCQAKLMKIADTYLVISKVGYLKQYLIHVVYKYSHLSSVLIVKSCITLPIFL